MYTCAAYGFVFLYVFLVEDDSCRRDAVLGSAIVIPSIIDLEQ